MFRKSKIEPVEKVKIVERYLAGEIGIQQLSYMRVAYQSAVALFISFHSFLK